MAFTYNLGPRGGDIHDASPYWFAAFIRFQVRDTFTRRQMSSLPQNSSNMFPTDGVLEQSEVLIADGDVVSWNVSSGKNSHVSSCSLQLAAGNTDYVAQLASGDWMGFWAFDNKEDFERVRRAVLGRRQANGFLDGLKFIGRVDSVRRDTSRAAGGQLSIEYSITGQGFSEFDSTIYYNALFKAKYGNDALLWMMDFGGAANNLILGVARQKGLITSQDALPKLLRICLGVSQNFGSGAVQGPATEDGTGPVSVAASFDRKENSALHGSPNKGYLVPETVGLWLNAQSTVKDSLSYVDLLRTYVGIQSYAGGEAHRDDITNITRFVPQWRSIDQNVYLMNQDLTGEYRVLTMHFDNRSVWSILQTYVNEPVDELYTCLRVDASGAVMPTLVCRQNPMSTKWYADNGDYPVTAFTDLPRWKLSSDRLLQASVGRSNAMRFNYMHLMGQDMTGANTRDNNSVNAVRNPPIVDPADINRSGLRMFIKQLSANVNEAQYNNDTSPGAKWQEILADILMGGHLKYTGTLVSEGIQEPICEGDNVEYDGVIYHIERVTHAGGISLMGQREFTTTLQLTNGISTENENLQGDTEIVYPDLPSEEPEAALIEEEEK